MRKKNKKQECPLRHCEKNMPCCKRFLKNSGHCADRYEKISPYWTR